MRKLGTHLVGGLRTGRNMRIETPKHQATLWIGANLALVAIVPAAIFYFERELRAGAYPVDADSIGIPILETGVSVLMLLPLLNLGCWLLLRRYPGKVPLYTSATGLRLAPRLVAWLVLAGGAGCMVIAVWCSIERAPEFTPVFILLSYVAFAIRAAYVKSVGLEKVLNQTT